MAQDRRARKAVYAVVGGTGTITVTRGGNSTTTPIGGPQTLHQIVGNNSGDTAHRDQLDMQVSNGLRLFSFTGSDRGAAANRTFNPISPAITHL